MSTTSQRVAGFGTTVFVEINNLARQYHAVNLGQGAPDFDGPPEVLAAAVNAVNGAHQFITFAVASPLQAAAATALTLPFSFFENLQASYQSRRDRMAEVLKKAGFKVFKSAGSYFIVIDWRGIAPAHVKDGLQFAEWLIREVGVACIPASPFYQECDRHLGKHFARFAVCKKDETLAAAADRLLRLGTG